MKFKVLEDFKERYDHNRIYEKDSEYPVGDFKPTDERIEELSTKNNDYSRPFIKAIKIEKKPAVKAKSKVADKDAEHKG